MEKLQFYTGGCPFDIDDLVWLQNGMIDALKSLCSGLGTGLASNASTHNAFILSGCGITGVSGAYTIASGFIYYNGEIFVVPSHTSTATTSLSWTIVGTPPLTAGVTVLPTQDTYEDSSLHYTRIVRQMQLTSGGTILITNCPNIRSVIGIVPTQAVLMYSGSVGNFDGTGKGNVGSTVEGYALCNGNNGTPNLQGRFIVGYNSLDADYSTIGNNGGSKTHTLTDAEIPAHLHHLVDPGHAHVITVAPGGSGVSTVPDTGSGSDVPGNPTNTASTGITLNNGTPDGGGGGAHENRPPYYTLAYIMKT